MRLPNLNALRMFDASAPPQLSTGHSRAEGDPRCCFPTNPWVRGWSGRKAGPPLVPTLRRDWLLARVQLPTTASTPP